MYFVGQLDEHLFSNDTPEYVLYDHSNAVTVQKILGIVSIAFIPFILVANSLVFWSTILIAHFHTPFNVFLFSLSIANLFMGCVCIPVFSVSYIDAANYIIYDSTFHCILWFASSWISAGGSLVSLLFISIDRYMAIVWPDKYKSLMTMKTSMVVVTLIWLCILSVTLIPILDLHYYRHRMGIAKRCNYFTAVPRYYSIVFTIITIYSCFAIPLILHVFICAKLYKQIRTVNREFNTIEKEDIRLLEEDVSSIVMTISMMMLFLLLWFPYLVIVSINYFGNVYDKQYESLQNIAQMFYFSNAMLSAPLYALVRRDYKTVYWLMLNTAPWAWKRVLRKLDYRRKSRAFRFPSTVSFVVRPSIAPILLTDKDLISEDVSKPPQVDLHPKVPKPVEHWSVSSLYPNETTIY